MNCFNARVTDYSPPLRSLAEGHWFKLICGASFQCLPDVRNLALVFALAGADCIDIAADPAVVSAARDGIAAARHWLAAHPALNNGHGVRMQPGSPWLMVSLNDGEDPHFRKAEFDPQGCLADCHRPCESICPADAIAFTDLAPTATPHLSDLASPQMSGVLDDRCYGCGRCLPVCPIHHIHTRSYVSSPVAIAPLILPDVDAIEIHTQVGRLADFERLWGAIAPHKNRLKALAISCPDGEELLEYLWAIHQLITPMPCPVIWQTDGRAMSGDIGKGATHATIRLGQKVLHGGPPGYVQLAGGTNAYTVPKLRELGLLRPLAPSGSQGETLSNFPRTIHGVAYGSYARTLLSPILQTLATQPPNPIHLGEQSLQPSEASQALEAFPALLHSALQQAIELISPLKLNESDLTPAIASTNQP